VDEFCNGKSDGICDPDCVEAELPDPDCVGCLGDCDADRNMTINELVRGVNIALGTAPLTDCPSFDRDPNERVTITELVQAANNALAGCQ